MHDSDAADDTSDDDSEASDSRSYASDPLQSNSWVIDSTVNSLLFQLIKTPGEEIAFAYCKHRLLEHDSGLTI